MPNLTLEEARRVVATFMEPQPEEKLYGVSELSEKGWWEYRWSVMGQKFKACTSDLVNSLDGLWLVEERLTEEQSCKYDHLLYISLVENKSKFLYCWHATADQKTLALARVIQGGAK